MKFYPPSQLPPMQEPPSPAAPDARGAWKSALVGAAIGAAFGTGGWLAWGGLVWLALPLATGAVGLWSRRSVGAGRPPVLW